MPSVVEAKSPEARRGPRPLSTHLLAAALTYASSNAALPLLKSGSPNWKTALGEWFSQVAEVDTLELTTAVEYESRRRLAAFLKGVKAYRNHPYRRTLPEPVVATRDGSSRLFEFSASGADDGPAILVVPSLVNRAYVLDLAEGQSFMRWLSANGVDGFLVDWGRPDDAERGFDLTNYIADRLERFFNLVYERSRKPVFVLGYCMGGNFALALTQRRQREVAGLALLATPWDFHATDKSAALALAATLRTFEPQLHVLGELPTDILQLLFCLLDPLLGYHKFRQFAFLDPNSEPARRFVALEDWLNEGVPLPASVARECLYGWYGENQPATGTWRIADEVVDPGRVDVPALVIVPQRDRIVPPESARVIADALPNCQLQEPNVGHIGLIAGSRAAAEVWSPVLAWIRTNDP